MERGRLFLVPTPIGNPSDLTARAIEVLAAVDTVAAEDTRSAMTLLHRLGLKKRVLSYFDHNEAGRAPQLVGEIEAGASVAIVSDAGTPVLSDPGWRVVTLALERGVEIVALPGACAATTALIASGLPTHRFLFLGFLPRAAGERLHALEELRALPWTMILYEAPHRVRETIGSLREALGDRRAALAFELTKPRERWLRAPLSAIEAELAEGDWMGEFTIVVAGLEDRDAIAWEKPDAVIRALLDAGVEPRAIRDALVAGFDLPKRAAYQRVLDAGATKARS